MSPSVPSRVPAAETITLSCHCHDDLGMAVANSLAAVRAGAGQIECTINGIGERAGNAALEEVVMALRTRREAFGADTNIETREIYRASRLVRDVTSFSVPPNKSVVGANAFAHASGIHQDGVIKSQMTYEIMRPEDVGLESNRLVLTSRSGRHAFKVRMASLGYDLADQELERAYQRFIEVADKKKEVFDQDLEALMAGGELERPDEYRLEYMSVTSSLSGVPTATLRLGRGDERITEAGTGLGRVDAVYRTIDKMIPVEH